MGKPSSSQPTQQNVKTETSNLPEYARPYFDNIMGRSQAESYRPYTAYDNPRIADFNSNQSQTNNNIMGMQAPNQFGQASGFTTAAGLGTLGSAYYQPNQFNAQTVGQPNLNSYSMQGPQNVEAQQYGAPSMQGAQTSYGSGPLEQYRMNAPQQFGNTQAQQYMSPYAQNVMDVQKREAVFDAQKGQLAQDLGAARQGTYGGSRQLLAGMERERNLGQQLGDIQARGQQASYENAQQQFERDRSAGMQTGQQNLNAALQQQNLGVSTGLQAALANLDKSQQANVQNLASQLQTQGLNSEQAMRAALANQQTGYNAGNTNLQSALQTQQLGTQSGLQALLANQQTGLEAQRLGEQSRQFGSQNALSAYGQLGQYGQTLSNIGQTQQNADMQRLGMQQGVGSAQQGLEQRYLDTDYADFLRQRDYDKEQLGYFSNLMRGIPIGLSTTNTTYAPPPSTLSQVAGAGLGAAGLYNMYKGG